MATGAAAKAGNGGNGGNAGAGAVGSTISVSGASVNVGFFTADGSGGTGCGGNGGVERRQQGHGAAQLATRW